MSTFIRRYSKYLNEKATSYRTMAFDFCKVKRGYVLVLVPGVKNTNIHHNLLIILLGSRAEIILVEQPCYIETKTYRVYSKNDHLWSFFYIIYTFLESIFKPCYIQNRVMTNSVIKRLMCIVEFQKSNYHDLHRIVRN